MRPNLIIPVATLCSKYFSIDSSFSDRYKYGRSGQSRSLLAMTANGQDVSWRALKFRRPMLYVFSEAFRYGGIAVLRREISEARSVRLVFRRHCIWPVSYTHLTLPTNREV